MWLKILCLFFKYLELYSADYHLMKKILLFIVLIASIALQAQTTHMVINTNDAGLGSLRAAADSCVAGDIIRFSPSLIANGSDSIVLTSGEIDFDSIGVVIKGVYTSSDTLFISGNQTSRIFSYDGAGKIVLDSMALINGNGEGTLSPGYGGAIYCNNCLDTLFVKNSFIHENKSTHAGGGICSRTSFYSSSRISSIIVVNNSVIKNNITCTTSGGTGGGGISSSSYSYSGTTFSSVLIYNSKITGNTCLLAGKGGGIYSKSSLSPYADTAISFVEVINSSVSDNICSNEGGIASIAFSSSTSNSISEYSESLVKVLNSTISDNSGNGIGSYASLTSTSSASKVMVSNSTVSGNDGIGVYSTVSNYSRSNSFASSISVLNSTVSGNTDRAIYSYGSHYSYRCTSDVTISGSIIALNDSLTSSVYNDHSPKIISNGYNVFDDSVSGVNLLDHVNISAAQLNLQPLTLNGGATMTVMPGLGSIALNDGNPTDYSDAQNAPIVGIRNIGAAENCYAIPSFISVTECSSYTVPSGNASYTQSGLYQDTILTGCGADSIIVIDLTIQQSFSNDVVSCCDSLTWINGLTYYASSNLVKDTLMNAAGCDSIITLDLTINYSTTATDVITSCNSFTWIDGVTYTSSNNSATDTLTNAVNCDSIITLDLTINYSTTATDVITSCDSLTWMDGVTYIASNNTATYTLANALNCDSLVTLDLTINYATTGIDVITSCDSLTWIDGVTYTASNNTVTHTLTNAMNCDSVVTLDLTINYATTGIDVITSCDSLTWIDGVTYTASNTTATHTLTNAMNCDSVVTLDLTINYATTATDVITSCNSFNWIDGVTYTSSNNSATHTLTNAMNCDSVITLDLTINNATSATDLITSCNSFTWIDGITYTSSNTTARDTLINAAGCDSIVTLNLTINQSTSGTESVTACDDYTWNGITYTSSNSTALDTLVNSVGCDSIVALNLTITQSTSGTDIVTACDDYTWNGITYTSSNSTALDTLVNAAGCDSIVTLNLTINQSTSGTEIVTACDSYTWINGMTYYSDNNTAKDTLLNSAGCDSIVALNLTIETIDSTVVQNKDTLRAVEAGVSYQWIDCSSNTIIAGAVWQQFVPNVSGSYKVEITKGICIDTSACFQVNVCDNQAEYTFIDNGAGDFDFTDASLGSYTQIHWSFGDGTTSTITNPNHLYQANGNYVVVLTINDSIANQTCVSHFMDTLSVTGVGTSLVCQAGFSVYYDTNAGTVNVVNSSIGNNLSYTWGFGDGTTSTQQFPTHSYATNGPFNFCLTIDDGSGCVDTYCDSISNHGIWFRSSGFDLMVEGAEPNAIVQVNLINNIHIYPNPVHDQVSIEITNWPTIGVHVVVRDMSGKLVFTQKVEPISNKETVTINTSQWTKGTYFIEVGDEVNRVTEKMVVQ